MKPTQKPLLRGYIHQEAFFVSLGMCTLLVVKSSTSRSLVASLVYSFGLLFLFGVSAFYHRPHWQPGARAWMKRLDHSAIFVLIASTFTPVCLLALGSEDGRKLLLAIWIAAICGIFQSVFWVKAPKWFTALVCVIVGWFAIPYLGALKISLGSLNLILLAAGGVAYTVGALFYALKRPRLKPEIFGYHELFHLLTVVGAGLHFAIIYQLIS